jgi:uncharacterized protein (DUF697 family)
MALPIRLSVLRALFKELSVDENATLAVGGARELAPVLRRELGCDARSGAVRSDDAPEGASVFVYVAAADVDKAVLKRARRARVPIVAVTGDDGDLPFVLATDVVRVRPGEGFPIAEIAKRVAARLGEDGAPLAARVPALRGAVADELIRAFARKNGIVAAAVFIPGADLPVLALNQIRMVLRLEQAYGLDVDPRERAPGTAATVAAGLGLRALARELLDLVPVAGWAVQGGVAYAGTRALGEAVVKRLEIAPPGGH